MKQTIAVLIPCYNEAVTIGKVVQDMKAVLPEAIIYVYDNNSTDNTTQIAKDQGAVVRREPRQGKGNVIRSMFRNIEADCYIILDGDDTYPAAHAPEMARLVLEEHMDMVIGDRLSSTYFQENKRAFHNLGNKLVRLLVNRLFHADIKDIMTGYRAFSKNFVKLFPALSEGFEIETEMTLHALDKNFNITAVPIDYRDRPEGSESKLNTIKDGIKVLTIIFTLYKDYKPLKFFSWMALLLFLLALGLFIPVFRLYLQTQLVERFPTLIVSGFLGLSALLSFSTGLILDVFHKKQEEMFENLYRLSKKN